MNMAKAKTEPKVETAAPKCPITREQFKKAQPIKVTIAGRDYLAMPKEFSTGSLGFYLGDKVVVEIDGVPVKLQLGCNMTIIGSKTA
jgi:hypothetical protein